MKVLFIIPARGGSKGLPGKNLMSLGGIPLVGRAARTACQAALGCAPGSRVLCSTDDPIIGRVAAEWGAQFPFLRPASLATDQAPSLDVVLHALQALAPEEYEAVVLLQPTSPLVRAEDVKGALRLHAETRQPVVSVCQLDHPAAWQFRLDEAGRLHRGGDLPSLARRQEAEAVYRLNGAVYVSTPDQLRRNGGFLGPETRGWVMPAERSVDIDVLSDLRCAEAAIRAWGVAPWGFGSRQVGEGQPCFVIAEAGVNHNGSLALACRLVDAARSASADAVKFQTFRADKLVAASAPKADYQARQTGTAESQLEMVRALELSHADFRELKAYCDAQGIIFLSTPFEEESADFLWELGVPLFKVPSGEITNLPFLAYLARKGRPLIVSTGMSHLSEVAAAVDCIWAHGHPPLALLQCVSNYPTQPADANLLAMRTLREAFQVPVGYSDHTLGTEIAVSAVALGASVIEKHFTLDRNLPGPDHKASLEPAQLAELVRSIRSVESALGSGLKVPAVSEANTAAVARKSLVAATRLTEGTVLTRAQVAVKRPGTGLSPALLEQILGRRVRRDVAADEILTLDVLE